MSDLLRIPGIGKKFVEDFARININSIDDLIEQDSDSLYSTLCVANERENHKTSKNYLYVIRMAIYYANGGRKADKLKWSAWKD